jgi:pyrimidine operon attenuation protein/uracil phosphoribosyltransferase
VFKTFQLSNTPAMKILLDAAQLSITLSRLAHQLAEQHDAFQDTALVGIQPRGVALSDRLVALVRGITGNEAIHYGKLDITFHRDDVHTGAGLHKPSVNSMPFSIEGRTVVLVDDVLHTGRTIRAAMDALLSYGRPSRVELLTLIDRKFSRELPVQPDYTGRSIDTIMTQKVIVDWEKEEVVLID